MRFFIVLFSLLFSRFLLVALAEQCGPDAGGALCPDGYCCSKYGWCGTTDPYCGHDCLSQCPDGPPPTPPTPTPPTPTPPTPSGGDVTDVLSESMFEVLLPYRNDVRCPGKGFYTYSAFVTAARSFPGFGTTGTIEARTREIAAFFAQTSHEITGGWATAPGGPYAWGYCLVNETGNPSGYCVANVQWPCAPGQSYFGRGPIQLSYNFNYGPCGRDIGEDILANPDLVGTDPVISFKAAIWFWMYPQPPKPSCHDVILDLWTPSKDDVDANRLPGYGVITNIINGGLECGHGDDDRVKNRIGFYLHFCDILGVSPGDNLDCGDQRPFGYGVFHNTM